MTDPRPRRIVPAGLLGMIALVAAVETGIARQVDRFTSTSALAWRITGESAKRQAAGRDVLFLGDSLVKHGLLPPSFERATGLTALNLALPSASAATSYFLLGRALAAGAHPTAIVVDFKPLLLAARPRRTLRQWSEVLSIRELIDLAWTARNPSLGLEILVEMALPSWRSRYEVRDAVVHALRGEDDPLAATNRACRRNWSLNGGANVATRDPNFTGDVPPHIAAEMVTRRWTCRGVNATFVERFLALAESRQIPVYWLLPPACPELERSREIAGDEARFRAYVQSVEARHPKLTVLDGRDSSWDHSVFIDPTHLDGRGAVALTRAVAEAIRAPREAWAVIRRGADSGPLPETVDESRIVLERAETIVR